MIQKLTLTKFLNQTNLKIQENYLPKNLWKLVISLFRSTVFGSGEKRLKTKK